MSVFWFDPYDGYNKPDFLAKKTYQQLAAEGRTPKIFTSMQIQEAGMKAFDTMMREALNDPTAQLLTMRMFSHLMVNLGIGNPEEFFEPES